MASRGSRSHHPCTPRARGWRSGTWLSHRGMCNIPIQSPFMCRLSIIVIVRTIDMHSPKPVLARHTYTCTYTYRLPTMYRYRSAQ